jgi:hypothetical protein
MEIYCADCGCLVDRGIRVIACDSSECCCLDLPMVEPMQALAVRTRRAFNTRDIDTMRSLIAQDATWGENPEGDSFCHDRDAIITNLKRLLAEGIQATIVDTTTGPRGIAAHIQVEWPDPATARADRIDFFQAYVVTGGLITEIHGHDTHDSAMAAIST